MGCVVIQEVPVDVDAVFVHTPQPGEAPGVYRVHEDERDVSGQTPRQPLSEQEPLDPRAAETLDPMGAGRDEEYAAGVGRAEARLVEKEIRSVGARQGMPMGHDRSIRDRAGAQECVSRLTMAFREAGRRRDSRHQTSVLIVPARREPR